MGKKVVRSMNCRPSNHWMSWHRPKSADSEDAGGAWVWVRVRHTYYLTINIPYPIILPPRVVIYLYLKHRVHITARTRAMLPDQKIEIL